MKPVKYKTINTLRSEDPSLQNLLLLAHTCSLIITVDESSLRCAVCVSVCVRACVRVCVRARCSHMHVNHEASRKK